MHLNKNIQHGLIIVLIFLCFNVEKQKTKDYNIPWNFYSRGYYEI